MKISNEKVIYSFSTEHEPIAKVSPGEKIEIETFDCFSNQLQSEEDSFGSLDWNKINPATGPIWIEDAKPGDVLKVMIHKIELGSQGVVVAGEGMGVLGDLLSGAETKIIPIKDEGADFGKGRTFPLTKMVGVIGVAPEGEEVNTGTPGKHGGNMDNKMITEGASLYFNVNTEGALFGLGDVHAVMGDGEIGVSGLEIPAKVTVSFELIKDSKVEFPMLENDESWSVIASEETVDMAVQSGTESMFRFLKPQLDLTDHEIAMLMSLVGSLEICQVVDPLKTVRFVIPKSALLAEVKI